MKCQLQASITSLMLAVSVFEVLENLCRPTALQGRQTTVSGKLQAVNQTISRLNEPRCDDHFQFLYQAADDNTREFDRESTILPRQSRPPRKREYTNNNHHVHDSAAAYFKQVYSVAVDTAVQSYICTLDLSSKVSL